MVDYLSNDERAERRYGKAKIRTPRPSTAELVNARDKLRRDMTADAAQQKDVEENHGIEAADRMQATKNASRSGDYDAGGNYKPFEPKRSDD